MKKFAVAIPLFSICALFSLAASAPESDSSILTKNVVDVRETISPQGFVHPGISCNAETLNVMREKVLAGVSPWVDYFEGMRRTRFADLNCRPKLVRQITNDGGISNLAHDAHLAWVHTILYLVTGNEDYRKTPVEIIRWYGSRTDESFFPQAFPDSHIKIGKYVYTLCSAVDILRSTTPGNRQLAVTGDMVDALQKNCIYPIRKNCIERNGYFMNQHSYAIMGYLASTILGNETEDYKQAVEWTTVNATSPNQGRNGSIKQQIRMVTRDDKTGEAVEPRLQVVEMGRDQPHAGGNIDNLLMMAKTIEFQRTRLDPVNGTVTKAKDGVSPLHFLDDRLPRGAALFAKYNIGFGLEPWVSVFSETDPKQPDYKARYDQISYFGRGAIGGNGIPAGYHYYKAMGFDLESGPYQYIKAAYDSNAVGREILARSGKYLDQIHNYAFDFWIGLPASASDSSPNPEKARRALATELPPLQVVRDGVPVEGQQIEYQFMDLSSHAAAGDRYPGSPNDKPLQIVRDPDGTGFVRMVLDPGVSRSMVVSGRLAEGAGFRIRSDSLVRLRFYADEDFERQGCLQEISVPDTERRWNYVTTTFQRSGLIYIEATALAGRAVVDFDRIETDASLLRSPEFACQGDRISIPAFAGGHLEEVIASGHPSSDVSYRTDNLPTGAKFDAETGVLSWTPTMEQVGDHTLYVTARDGDTIRTLRVDIPVARDLQAALDSVARAYDPSQRYVSVTEQAFKSALTARNLRALKQAADGLELLTPRLPDGTLDYCKAWSSTEKGSARMADGDPLTFGGLWGFDKNITMDFGNRFKVKSEAFRIKARDGFPIRIAEAVVYGSNDRKHWTLLTENKAEATPELQTLVVREGERARAYRYLRFFMPAKPYAIFEIAELRIVGERIEDPSPDLYLAYISGYPDGTFRPNQKLTRGEAVSLLAGLVDDYTDKGAYDCSFIDVKRDAPYFDDVAYMSSKGLVAGDDAKRFHPDNPISRGELAAIMARMQGLKGKDMPALKDVGVNTAYADEIRRVVKEGWVKADESGAFRPDDPVTRAEFVVAANRMTGRTGSPHSGTPSFSDVPASHWACEEIMKAASTYPSPVAMGTTAPGH
ncbi:hypothetical protein DB345_11220 [Spartobacteria bacterium LR76]|nr:hypothetical protein DB345_11220 [Spartobacteria bacterium LR76]